MIQEHRFTGRIREILDRHFDAKAEDIVNSSLLVQYVNEKTKSADKESKSRSSFGNLYALYVLIEDYVRKGYHAGADKQYRDYEGAVYSDLVKRQRELPFGAKLQNHSLNNRTNSEFSKYFPTSNIEPIIRNQETSRYWINENLLLIPLHGEHVNIAEAIIEIIDEYVKTKLDSFNCFIEQCTELQSIENQNDDQIKAFVESLLAPSVDARLFEIVSFAILKYFYREQNIYWGYEMDNIEEENLKLYKTGRTNANDGGIDFVMKPLGRFFQVTETLDFKKYFLDIEKVERYPITFVIKSVDSIAEISNKIEQNALKIYPVKSVVDRYMQCIEEIINIPQLMIYFQKVCDNSHIREVLDEIVIQSKVEYNFLEGETEEDD